MKETLVYNGEQPLYFVCALCGRTITENPVLTLKSNTDLNIKVTAKCTDCEVNMHTIHNKQLAESVKRFAKSHVFVDKIVEGPECGYFEFSSEYTEFDKETGETVIKYVPYIEMEDKKVCVYMEETYYDNNYVVKCKDFNNEEARQSWYDKIEEISKMI